MQQTGCLPSPPTMLFLVQTRSGLHGGERAIAYRAERGNVSVACSGDTDRNTLTQVSLMRRNNHNQRRYSRTCL
jgi:hypothetical protein